MEGVSKKPRLHLCDLHPVRTAARAVFPFNAPRHRWFAFGRNALYAALRALRVRPDDEILLPAFHCVALVEPFVRYGVRCRFYGVDRRLRADMSSLERAVSDRTRIVVVIHFLGFPQPLNDIRAICAARGLVLLEDCAHALYSRHDGRCLGADGDLALFSIRKTMATVDGAILVANDAATPLPDPVRGPGWRYAARAAKWTMDMLGSGRADFDIDVHDESPSEVPDLNIAPRKGGGALTPDGWLYGYELNPSLNQARGWIGTKWIASRMNSEAIRSLRRRNYLHMLEALGDVAAEHVPLADLPDGVCPWTFPIDARGRVGLDRRLRRLGVPAFTFGEALHQALGEGEYPDAEYLALNLILLPIHQDLSLEQVGWMADAVRKVVLST